MRFAIVLALMLVASFACAVPARAIPPPGMPQETIERVGALPGSAGIAWDVRFNRTNLRLTDDDGAATVAFAYYLMTSEAAQSVYHEPTTLAGWLDARVEHWSVAGPWLRAGLERLIASYSGQAATQQELRAIRAALFPAREIVQAPTYSQLNAVARWCDAHNKDHQYWVEVLDAQPHWPYPRRIKVRLRDNDNQKNPVGTALSGRTYEFRDGMIFSRTQTIFAGGWLQVLSLVAPASIRSAGPAGDTAVARPELPTAKLQLDPADLAAERARAESDARRIVRFARLHAGAPVAKTETGDTLAPAVALEALAGLARGLDYSGTGDVDYWFRAATDLARSGRAIGAAVIAVGRAMPDDAVARLVVHSGQQLAALQASGTGDANYWLATTKGLGDRIASTGGLLAQLAAATAASSQGIPLKVVVDGLVAFACSVDASGTGNLNFWMRATEHNAQVSRAVGKQLKAIAQVAPPALAPVLGAVASMFAGVSASGSGTVDYWLARATATAREVRGHAATLATLTGSR